MNASGSSRLATIVPTDWTTLKIVKFEIYGLINDECSNTAIKLKLHRSFHAKRNKCYTRCSLYLRGLRRHTICSSNEHEYLSFVNRSCSDFLFVDVFKSLKNVDERKKFICDF